MLKVNCCLILLTLIILPRTLTGADTLPRVKRIVGGQVADGDKWRFVTLVQAEENGQNFTCTGSIISSRHVLTAAHCLVKFRRLKDNPDIFFIVHRQDILVGINTENNNSIDALKLIAVKRVYVHHGYNADLQTHDVAILEVSEPFNPEITPITLSTYDKYDSSPGQKVLQLGFGMYYGKDDFDYYDPLLSTSNLRQFRTYIHHIIRCFAMWHYKLRNHLFCVGNPNDGAAPGDSGGPLLLKGSDARYYQIGIAAFAGDAHHAIENKSPAFLKVSRYCSWIRKVTSGEAECKDIDYVQQSPHFFINDLVMEGFEGLPPNEIPTTEIPTTEILTTEASNAIPILSAELCTIVMCLIISLLLHW